MSHAVPVGGNVLTGRFKVLLAFIFTAIILLIWRFVAGLGPTTAMNDGYPWGIWIVYDVVTGTAIACGGYAMAILVYILNKGRYHPLIRPAILTGALGYSLAGFHIFVDIGRWWNIYKVPIFFWQWNLNSILLEVALCVMSYIIVLWIELAPAFLEKWEKNPEGFLGRVARTWNPILNKLLIFIVALGILLPTMHQSSLGSLMLLAGQKLHPLWSTPLLGLLFLISCIGMGYGVVVMESSLAHAVFKRKPETSMLASLSSAMVIVLLLYVVIRIVDLAIRGRLGMAFAFDGPSIWFLLEMLLFLVPALMLMAKGKLRNLGYLFQAGMLTLLGGGLYRFSTYLIQYSPGEGWSYFPSVPEFLITVGVVAAEIAIYIWIVRKFPIIGGIHSTTKSEGAAR